MTQLQPDLRNADYQGQNLRSRSFMMADLRGASFRNCDLTGADFRWADLRDVCFDGAVLDHADFSGAVLDKPLDLAEYSSTPAKKWRVKVEVITTAEEWVDVIARDRKEAEEKAICEGYEKYGSDEINVLYAKEETES